MLEPEIAMDLVGFTNRLAAWSAKHGQYFNVEDLKGPDRLYQAWLRTGVGYASITCNLVYHADTCLVLFVHGKPFHFGNQVSAWANALAKIEAVTEWADRSMRALQEINDGLQEVTHDNEACVRVDIPMFVNQAKITGLALEKVKQKAKLEEQYALDAAAEASREKLVDPQMMAMARLISKRMRKHGKSKEPNEAFMSDIDYIEDLVLAGRIDERMYIQMMGEVGA